MPTGRTTSRSRPLRAIFTLALIALATTSIVAIRVKPLDPGHSCCDMLFYRSMAFNLIRETRPELNAPPPEISLQAIYEDPYFGKYYKSENHLNRQPPYVYRPAAPLLARTLARLPNLDINRAFRTLAFLSLWAVPFFTALTVFDVSGSLLASASSIVTLSALYRITAYHFWNYTMADPLAMALIALAIWLIFQRRDGWFLAVAAIGLFTKEIFALALVSFVLLLVLQRRMERRILVGLGGVTALYMLYRLAIPIPNNALTFSNAYVGPPGISETADLAFAVFGPLILFAATRLWFSREALILSPMIVGIYLLAMLTPDRERLFVYAFPVIVVAVFAHPTDSRLMLSALALPALLSFAFTQRHALPVEIDDNSWQVLTLVAILIIEPVLLLSPRLRERFLAIWLPSRTRT